MESVRTWIYHIKRVLPIPTECRTRTKWFSTDSFMQLWRWWQVWRWQRSTRRVESPCLSSHHPHRWRHSEDSFIVFVFVFIVNQHLFLDLYQLIFVITPYHVNPSGICIRIYRISVLGLNFIRICYQYVFQKCALYGHHRGAQKSHMEGDWICFKLWVNFS